MKEETTLSQDVKTMWVGGCKAVVAWIQTFGEPKDISFEVEEELGVIDKLPKHGMLTKEKPKRARGLKGRYKGGDLSTAYTNEAWVGGKAPKRGKK